MNEGKTPKVIRRNIRIKGTLQIDGGLHGFWFKVWATLTVFVSLLFTRMVFPDLSVIWAFLTWIGSGILFGFLFGILLSWLTRRLNIRGEISQQSH